MLNEIKKDADKQGKKAELEKIANLTGCIAAFL